MKILFVDDEPDVREYLGEWLDMKNYGEVFLAANGEEALAIVEQEKPDLVLLDVSLGDDSIDGMEVLKRIKADVSPETNVVMFSGHRDLYYTDSLKLGALDFWKKPLPFGELGKMFTEVFEKIKKE